MENKNLNNISKSLNEICSQCPIRKMFDNKNNVVKPADENPGIKSIVNDLPALRKETEQGREWEREHNQDICRCCQQTAVPQEKEDDKTEATQKEEASETTQTKDEFPRLESDRTVLGRLMATTLRNYISLDDAVILGRAAGEYNVRRWIWNDTADKLFKVIEHVCSQDLKIKGSRADMFRLIALASKTIVRMQLNAPCRSEIQQIMSMVEDLF